MAPQGIPPQEDEARPDYCNEAVFRRNCLPTRAYHIPSTSLLLNGSWDFHMASTPLEAPEPEDAGAVSWGKLAVPGHWQLQGHGRPHYTNTQFPIPVCPPAVPTENPTGTYRRAFTVPAAWAADAQLRLRFDGVDSAYHVWVNGVLVGYAQGSRNASEFDVSEYVNREGGNELLVRVYQWCDATYIEDQDQWWLSGIFRDVHLVALPAAARIEDWFLRTDLDDEYRDATLRATVDVLAQAAGTLRMTLSELASAGGKVIGTAEATVDADATKVDLELAVSDPRKWTAETPNLYTVELSLTTDSNTDAPHTVQQRIGFRRVELRDGLMRVNGVPLRIRGVNRHEHHPLFGRAVPLDFARRDLLLMKTHNVNALRFSHQPNDARLLDLCDELGLWVMDEADLECHGFYDTIARPQDIPEEMDYEERKKLTFPQAAAFTSDNPAWEGAYVDRMRSMVQRDKNHASVIIWSLGNEAFYGANQRAMSAYGKDVDPGRLIHYEGDVHAETADMYSYMYPQLDRLVRLAQEEGVAEDGSFDKPIVLCEYAHAMGNGPGWLEDYEAAFRAHPRLQGGYIWEWANHGLLTTDAAGREYYGYGGDFGDVPNDGTFVMDGLLNSKHEPTPGLTELKKVIQPVLFKLEDSKVVVQNLYNFVNLDHLSFTYKVEELDDESTILAAGELAIPDVQPGTTAEIEPPTPFADLARNNKEVFLTVTATLRTASAWAPAGHEIAWFQARLWGREEAAAPARVLNKVTAKPKVTTSGIKVTVSGDRYEFVFDRARGVLASWTRDGQALLEADPVTRSAVTPSFWRPATDNDNPHALPHWRLFGVDQFTSQLRSFAVDEAGEDSVVVRAHTFLSPPVLSWGWDCEAEYTVTATGGLRLDVKKLAPSGKTPDYLPRIGLNLRLSGELDRVRWLGLGPGESYPDKRDAQRMGVWGVGAVRELHTAYDVPQENGNRMATRWVSLTRRGQAGAAGLRVRRSAESEATEPEAGFSFLASRHSAETIQAARHPHDLVEEDATLLRLDVKVAGVGTGACGPAVRDDLMVKVEETSFAYEFEAI